MDYDKPQELTVTDECKIIMLDEDIHVVTPSGNVKYTHEQFSLLMNSINTGRLI